MKKKFNLLVFSCLATILFTACDENKKNDNGELVNIILNLSQETFNPLLEPETKGKISVTGVYSNGVNKPLDLENVELIVKTEAASGDVEVGIINGNELTPKEGGVGTLQAYYIEDGKTLMSEKDFVVRPFYRKYHETLVMKLFMGQEFYPEDRRKDEDGNLMPNIDTLCTFKEALEVIRKTDNVTRGIPKIIYLVGWQTGGHDHQYPAWSEVNPKLKRDEDSTAVASLRWLIREAKQYNTTVSLHINMVDAFEESPLWDEYVEKDIIAKDTNGNLILHGPHRVLKHRPFHVSYTREWEEKLGQKRIDDLIEMVPELIDGHTIHIDVFIAMYAPEGKRPISPWHAKPENGGIDMYKEVETQRKIFKYWREKGFDVTGEGILWAHPKDEGFYGLQPGSWWYPPIGPEFELRIPERLLARGRAGEGYGDFRFTSSMHGEEIWKEDKDSMPGFLEMFCQTTLPWYYASQHDRVSFSNETLYYSEGLRAGIEDGDSIMRKGDYILRENQNLFVEALWKEKEIIAYSEKGYEGKNWQLPESWKDVKAVKVSKITLEGLEPKHENLPIKDGKVQLSLAAKEAVSIVPEG